VLSLDPSVLLDAHREQLLKDVEHHRLLAQLPRRESIWRHQVAGMCLRLADWLDGSAERYFSRPETDPGIHGAA
jgi:hypothetical protein